MRGANFGKVFTAIALTAVVAAGGGAQARPADPNGGGEAIPVVEQIVNVIKEPWFRGLLIQPQAEMAYEETAMFDALLHKSLKAGQPSVTVQVNGTFKTDAVPARMGNWLKRVQSKGTVGQCQQEELSTGAIILDLIMMFYPQFSKWATYSPADKYNAIIYTTPKAEVSRIIFLLKPQKLVCDPGFKASVWAGSAAAK